MDDGMARAIASIRESFGGHIGSEHPSDEDIARGIGAFQESARSFGIPVDDVSRALASIGEALVDISPAAALGFREDVPGDHLETLLDLARAGDERTFKDLARALGVPPANVNSLWTGTLARRRGE